MALISNLAVRRDIPHEPGEWIEFRPLGWLDLERARTAQTSRVLRNAREMGAEVFSSLTDRERPAETAADPLAGYDRWELLSASIAGWSYADRLNKDAIARLDEQTALWAAREVLALSEPPTEEQLKNSALPSISR